MAFSYVEEPETTTLVANTDAGFFVSYNDGSSWAKLNYSLGINANIGAFKLVKSGSQYILYLIADNKLYRDVTLQGTLTDYTAGLPTSAGYFSTGSAVSKELLALSAETFPENYFIDEATLNANAELNGQSAAYFLSTNGTTWEAVELGKPHSFTDNAASLYWKIVLNTADSSKTPVVSDVTVSYGLSSSTQETGTQEPGAKCAGFSDILADDAQCAVITYAKDQGIFEGYPDGSFKPGEAINRAETVKVIVNGFKVALLADDGTNLGFSDVIKGEWYMGFLRTAKDAGIIQGYPDGTFKPEQTVNYVEMYKIFFETADSTLTEAVVSSAVAEPWYQKYLDAARDNSITVAADYAAPMTRYDVAKLFYEWSKRTPAASHGIVLSGE